MGRRFLPGLRGLAGETKDLRADESKVVSWGGTYSSIATAGVSFGLEDRAAGWDMNTVIVEGYERGVWVFKSVEFIAGHASRLPFRVGRDLDSDDRQVQDNHPLYRVLNKQANPLETGRQFRKRLSAQVLLSKRGAFVEVGKSRAGTITRLDLLPPDRVIPRPSVFDGFTLSHFEYIDRMGAIREIDPERIRWIREPHPTDPFSGVTPLEAAGISVELDHLARLYNVNYLKNDGRPGGVIGVNTDGMEDQELERIERKFAPGADHAGKTTVLGTGPGGINYVDTSAKPRDMSYEQLSTTAKQEILSAFGLDESVIGQVANRTYDNAEQALFNAWTEVLTPHLDLIAGAFDRDVDEEWDPFIDTSSVEVLELPRRRKRTEALAEWTAGLRSIDEYRPLAGLDPIRSAYSRALWISPSKAPVAASPGDEQTLGLAGGAQPGAGPAGGPGQGPADPTATPSGQPIPPAGTAAEAVAHAQGQTSGSAGGGAAAAALGQARQQGTGVDPASAAAAVGQARSIGGQGGIPGAAAGAVGQARAAGGQGGQPGDAAAAVDLARQSQTKSLPGVEVKAASTARPAGQVDYAPDDSETQRTELAVSAALDALLARQAGVVQARLESPKARKGTRFWQSDSPADTRTGQDGIDTARVVDEDRWVDETTQTLLPIVAPAAGTAGAGLLGALAASAVIASAPAASGTAPLWTAEGTQMTAAVVLGVLTSAGEAMRAWLRDVARKVDAEQQAAGTVDELVQTVRSFYADRAHSFATSLATSLAGATVGGARDATAQALLSMPTAQPGATSLPSTKAVIRTWVTEHDERVRPSHAAVDGETLPVGTPFTVGGALLRYPCDPLAPPAETRGCRCHLSYRTSSQARFLLPPIGKATP